MARGKKRGSKREVFKASNEISNRTVVLVLILVMLVSIISLGIYIATVQEIQNQEAPPAMIIDLSQEPTINQHQPVLTKT
ncbi:MAG: hypothetical protein AABX04_04265 [Nanoarchaeota archaeon]